MPCSSSFCTLEAQVASKDAQSPANDLRILAEALVAERQGIAAYQVGAASGLLQKPVLDLAVQFQGHHKKHADLLIATIKQLGRTPAQESARHEFPLDKLKSQADVVRFAAGLEHGAVGAYLNSIPRFTDRDLSRAAGSILGDEAMHWAVLRNALGENPVPEAFLGQRKSFRGSGCANRSSAGAFTFLGTYSEVVPEKDCDDPSADQGDRPEVGVVLVSELHKDCRNRQHAKERGVERCAEPTDDERQNQEREEHQ